MRFLAISVLILGVLGLTLSFFVRRSQTCVAPAEALTPDRPVSFGFKTIWIAVRTTDTEAVASALGLENRHPCNWKRGIEAAYEGNTFVTPPIGEWTLAVGRQLPSADVRGSEAEVDALLVRLSRKFGEAQWFNTHRVVEYHAWAKAVNGNVVRHFSYSGESGKVLRSEGPLTDGEPAGLVGYDFSPGANPEGGASIHIPDEDTVMAVARSWSTDPSSLETRDGLGEGLGILGQFSSKASRR